MHLNNRNRLIKRNRQRRRRFSDEVESKHVSVSEAEAVMRALLHQQL